MRRPVRLPRFPMHAADGHARLKRAWLAKNSRFGRSLMDRPRAALSSVRPGKQMQARNQTAQKHPARALLAYMRACKHALCYVVGLICGLNLVRLVVQCYQVFVSWCMTRYHACATGLLVMHRTRSPPFPPSILLVGRTLYFSYASNGNGWKARIKKKYTHQF